MFQNVLAATLRNLLRNRLYAAISIVGLAVGMAAAILTGVFVRSELTFDRGTPGYQDLYVVTVHFDSAGMNHQRSAQTPFELGRSLKETFPELGTMARYANYYETVTRDEVETSELIGWIDPDFFALFPFKTLAGDLQSAMRRPDGLVVTQALARKYFGEENPLGKTLILNRKASFRIMAIIEDMPDNSTMTSAAFASGRAPISYMAERDAKPARVGSFNSAARLFIRVKDPATAARINAALPDFVAQRLFPPEIGPRPQFALGLKLSLTPVSDLHFIREPASIALSGDIGAVRALTMIAGLILLIAGVNFVNLMTVSAAGRAMEIGVRKAAGAERRHLVLQFLGEAMVYTLLALLLAHALVELVLPTLNALLQRRLRLDYLADPEILAGVMGMTLILGIGAGAYPALVLSAFRPREVLKGLPAKLGGSPQVRAVLVSLQFAALIGLLVSVAVIAQQTRFAMTQGTGLDTERMLRVFLTCYEPGAAKRSIFIDRVAALPGVRGVACSAEVPLGMGDLNRTVVTPDGKARNVSLAPVGAGFFELYAVRPLAGRLPAADVGADSTLKDDGTIASPYSKNEVINAALARAMGFAEPADAVGKTFRVKGPAGLSEPLTVIGVVPDTAFDLRRGPPKPAIHSVDPSSFYALSVKLKAGMIPETVAAIDRIWKESGEPRPINRTFTDDFLDVVYATVLHQGWLIGALAGVALFIGCLGLFGLAAFTAERRTKEIGVRKALGASRGDIVRLLLWSFSQPVLWANLIAWPVAWWAMSRWLQGFAYRIALEPWMFLAAGAAALVIAALTVSAHAVRVARAKPVGALRYE